MIAISVTGNSEERAYKVDLEVTISDCVIVDPFVNFGTGTSCNELRQGISEI
jgi:RecA-family ATPase